MLISQIETHTAHRFYSIMAAMFTLDAKWNFFRCWNAAQGLLGYFPGEFEEGIESSGLLMHGNLHSEAL